MIFFLDLEILQLFIFIFFISLVDAFIFLNINLYGWEFFNKKVNYILIKTIVDYAQSQ